MTVRPMLQNDRDVFAGLMENLRVVFKREVDDQLIALYWDALKDQPITKVRIQVERHIRYGKHFPRPSELREPPRKPDPAPLVLTQPSPDSDGFDKWSKTASELLLKHITTRGSIDTRRYGDSSWSPKTGLHVEPNLRERVAILVAYKNAWIGDMREEEAIQGSVSAKFSKSNWDQLMVLAEKEIDKLIERDQNSSVDTARC